MQWNQQWAYQLLRRLDAQWESAERHPPGRLAQLVDAAPVNVQTRIAESVAPLKEYREKAGYTVPLDPEFLEAQAAYLSDADILKLYNIVEGIAKRRGLMG